jgi:hypothetical protein
MCHGRHPPPPPSLCLSENADGRPLAGSRLATKGLMPPIAGRTAITASARTLPRCHSEGARPGPSPLHPLRAPEESGRAATALARARPQSSARSRVPDPLRPPSASDARPPIRAASQGIAIRWMMCHGRHPPPPSPSSPSETRTLKNPSAAIPRRRALSLGVILRARVRHLQRCTPSARPKNLVAPRRHSPVHDLRAQPAVESLTRCDHRPRPMHGLPVRAASQRIAIRWMMCHGRHPPPPPPSCLSEKTRMAVPSPAAASLPRV